VSYLRQTGLWGQVRIIAPQLAPRSIHAYGQAAHHAASILPCRGVHGPGSAACFSRQGDGRVVAKVAPQFVPTGAELGPVTEDAGSCPFGITALLAEFRKHMCDRVMTGGESRIGLR